MTDKPNPIQIQKFLSGINYPARTTDLVDTAEKEGADANVLDALKSLPDQEFTSPADVSKAIGREE